MFKKGKYLILILLFSLFGCQSIQQETIQKKRVTVTTSFIADMVHQIGGEYFRVDLLIPAGEDPHVYVAKTSDYDKIKNSDLVLYHGLHFEGKMIDILEKKGKAITEEMSVDNLITVDEAGQKVYDPHFWFDISLYQQAVKTVSTHLITLAPNQKDNLTQRTEQYLKQLDQLKNETQQKINHISSDKRILVTPHDAFAYFAREYAFQVIAPQGISTHAEVDQKTMMETVDFIVENRVKAIFTESTTNPERMLALQEAVKFKGWQVKVVNGEDEMLFSDSLAPKGKKGDEFIKMYQHNVDMIVSHLK